MSKRRLTSRYFFQMIVLGTFFGVGISIIYWLLALLSDLDIPLIHAIIYGILLGSILGGINGFLVVLFGRAVALGITGFLFFASFVGLSPTLGHLLLLVVMSLFATVYANNYLMNRNEKS